MAFSFLTLNCIGLRDEQRRLGLLQWLRCLQSPVDFVCLQETHCTSASEASPWFSSSGYSVASSPGSFQSCGCLVFSLLSCRLDSDGRFLALIFISTMFALAWYVYMHLIVILLGTIFWIIFRVTLISLHRPLSVLTSIQCLIGLLTGVGLLFFIPLARARRRCLPSLFFVASLISGVTFILNASSLRGQSRMDLCPPGSILSVAPTLGFPQFHLVRSCLVHFRIAALSLSPDSFRLPFLGAPAFGN